MMRRTLALAATVVVLVLTSCSTDEGDGSGGGDHGPVEVGEALQESIDQVDKVVEITEDNDPNDLIGRPSGYVAAATVYDSRAECEDLSVDCGATIEQFASGDAARERAEYIEGFGTLANEYHYLDGDTLLRVSGTLKPSEAEEYEAAFTG